MVKVTPTDKNASGIMVTDPQIPPLIMEGRDLLC